MTPLEARAIVASFMRQGLLRAPEHVGSGLDPAEHAKRAAQAKRTQAMHRYWEDAAMLRGRKRWRDMTPEEQRAVRALYMRQLRGKRRQMGWTTAEVVLGRRGDPATVKSVPEIVS
jgi:hypothetical protein